MTTRNARALVILTENDTLLPAGDIGAIVDLARTAERAGADGVMISDHVCLGPDAGSGGRRANPRAYAAPGEQDPAMEWPSPIVLAAAIAATTTTVRIALAALITPLRNPVVLAKDLATLDRLSQGRLVVQPTVSWSRDEYAAVGVPFERRGAVLDEGLEAMQALWARSPASHAGPRFRFDAVYSEPKPLRPEGPTLWFGGQHLHPPLLRRLVTNGAGFHPFGQPTEDELAALADAMAAAGRSLDDLELVGGTRATFPDDDRPADLDAAMAPIVEQRAQGYTTFCIKPSQHTDDPRDVPEVIRTFVEFLDGLEPV